MEKKKKSLKKNSQSIHKMKLTSLYLETHTKQNPPQSIKESQKTRIEVVASQ